jgi:peptidoglycan/LPS O-acetylase OafA/YrhL
VSPAPKRLDVFDGLRGIAILLVVWYHARLVSGQGAGILSGFVDAGFLGVDLFFFISGFCLFFPYARAMFQKREAPGWQHFVERRALKIVPSYLFALGLFTLIYRMRFSSPQDALVQIAAHLTFLHTLSASTFGTISGPLWTIGIEVQFYMLFPLLAVGFMRSPLVGYAVLVGLAEAYRAWIGTQGLDTDLWWISQLPAFLDVFGAGMIASWLLVLLRDRVTARIRTVATVTSLAAFALAGAGLIATSSAVSAGSSEAFHVWLNAHRILIGPLCIVLGVATSLGAERWRSIVGARPLVLLSAISYNLYLWHLEVMVWIRDAGFPPMLTIVASIGVALGVAAFVSVYLERPVLAMSFASLIDRLRLVRRTHRKSSPPTSLRLERYDSARMADIGSRRSDGVATG